MSMQALNQSNPSFCNTHRGFDNYMYRFNEAVQRNHQVFIDDAIPANVPLKNFFLELRHKLRGLIPHFSGSVIDKAFCSEGEYEVYAGFRLAYDHAPDLTVGKIWVEKSPGGDWRYAVESDRITNERYKAGNRNYNIKTSNNFKTAIKTAVQHLKPVRPQDLSDAHNGNLYSAKQSIIRPALEKMVKVLRMPETDLFKELLNLQRSGYIPATQSMANAFKILEAEGEELYSTSRYEPRTAFIWMRSTDAVMCIKGEELQYFKSFDEFPEHIRNKLAVLQIGESGSTIKDVGHKVDATKYWVFL